MNNPEIMAAKMICKSVDALTREIYLLRKSTEEKAQPKQEYCLIQFDQDYFTFPAVVSGSGIIKAKVQRTSCNAVDPWFQVSF